MSNLYRLPPQLPMNFDGLVIDNFAGGGGASTGIEMALGRAVDIAINHDPEAIAMHTVTIHILSTIVSLYGILTLEKLLTVNLLS